MRKWALCFTPLEVLAILAALFAVLCPVTAAASGLAESIPFKVVFAQGRPIVIPVASQPGKTELTLPAIPEDKDGVTCIRFRAFIRNDVSGGWGTYLRLRLNGKSVASEMPDGSERLLNRGRTLVTADGVKTSWWDKDMLLAFYGSESELDARVVSPREEGYWYLLNIADLVSLSRIGVDDRLESGAPNHLVIENLYDARSDCREMVIKDLEIGHVPRAELAKLQESSVAPFPSLTGKTVRAGRGVLTVASSGGMELRVGPDRYAFSSSFSYPAEVIGYNRFSWERASSPEWKPRVFSGKQGSLMVFGESRDYSVTRSITPSEGRFLIRDTVRNLTGEPIGMIVRNQMLVKKVFTPGDTRLCGVSDARRIEACAANPTMFARQSGSSLGIVCEDTLFRMQLVADRVDNYVQFGTEHFGLAPRAEYTLEWTLYPSRGRDYFAFVNRVRKDWNVNYTIPGPATFSTKPVAGRSIKLYMMKPWFLYYNGAEMTDQEFKKVQQAQIADLLAVQPDATPVGMIETNLVLLKRREIQGGEQIPTAETYGLELTAEQAVPFRELPWYDSMIKTADGRPFIDTLYSKPPFLDIMVYPAPGNYQLKYLKYEIDFLMDQVGFKGIYLDQFELASTVTGIGRADYSSWDGHTVDLDDRGGILRRYTDATYVGTPARLEIIRHVQEKGGVLITNGHSYARETNGIGVVNFSETEWDVATGEEILAWNEPPALPAIAEAHLDSPVGLGIRPARFGTYGEEHFAEIIHKWVITFLKNGILYYYYQDTMPASGPGAGEYGVLNHMFPFTPVELHEGWIAGKERILTAKSGTYFWNHSEKPAVLLFDIKGREKQPDVRVVRKGKGWQVKLAMTDWQEAAVIESPSEK